eukprot:scaffold6311_cov163-Skeletonema_menzelii.AAC.1
MEEAVVVDVAVVAGEDAKHPLFASRCRTNYTGFPSTSLHLRINSSVYYRNRKNNKGCYPFGTPKKECYNPVIYTNK